MLEQKQAAYDAECQEIQSIKVHLKRSRGFVLLVRSASLL